MDILTASVSIFITQLIFIGARTWNVICVSKLNLWGAVMSGAIVHVSWLVSIAIGGFSMYEILANFRFDYLPIVVCSLTGGLYGTYLAIKREKSKAKTKVIPQIKPYEKTIDQIVDYLSVYSSIELTKENENIYTKKPDVEYRLINEYDRVYIGSKNWEIRNVVKSMMKNLAKKVYDLTDQGVFLKPIIVKELVIKPDMFVIPIKIDGFYFLVTGLYNHSLLSVDLTMVCYVKKEN